MAADVNHHCPANASMRRVAYQYSLMSTRGFTKHAVAYARTHGIALHDFSGDAWQAVRDTVDLAVETFMPLLAGAGGYKAVPLSSLRRLLRRRWPPSSAPTATIPSPWPRSTGRARAAPRQVAAHRLPVRAAAAGAAP
ncbi:hypothetical protein SAMN06264364_11781 [Quadrisphaera granulorum]|uniref:Uncharacterized protein n=1 Tax=Quadrisphaera granulorum TaxID=317664 RepID=A0A316A5M5_9ACTN|nr:hypothetical protein [Quadrisphaera granulorum]PWJ52829.1 hypothetical protein BXY45_11781 [Quadrisphaera granulorum]SZE97434.1 hypothetical protein SAMN06264364_11781 [Quadrisphaera granulorum]